MWGLVDCDNFFCSCERIFRPDLNGVPIVVLSNNDGCVVARSAEAKSLGIKMGLPYFQLRERFNEKEVIAFSSNYLLYADISNRIMTIVKDNVPKVYQYSIDEVMMDLSELKPEERKSFGESLAAKILKYTGAPVSIGIAPTKTLAKVAVKYAKTYPGYKKCTVISNDAQLEKALKLFPIEDVWGIGRRLAAALKPYNVNTAWDFVQKPQAWVKKHFHVTAERTWLELRGNHAIEIQEMEGTRKSIMTSRSFPEMITDYEDLRTHVANFASHCARKLRKQDSVAGTVMTFIQSNFFRDDLPNYSSSWVTSFATPTSTTTDIVKAATAILKRIYREGIQYKRAGVMVSAITTASHIQPDLFTFNPEERLKRNRLSRVIDKINKLQGPDTVIVATQQYKEIDENGKHLHFKNAIRRSFKSPDYSTSYNAFLIH